MPDRVQIRCANKRGRFNPHERITQVGGVNADNTRWRITQDQAIAGIEGGKWSFYTNVGGNVVPNGNGGTVRRSGQQKPVSNHRAQGAAEDVGRRIAQRNESELVIQRPNGQIRDKDSYGSDPHPPKDRKH